MSREFHKFFGAINYCIYKTHGYHKTFAFRKNNFAFSPNFCIMHFRFIFFAKKNCDMRPKILPFFRETFRSLETLPFMHRWQCQIFNGTLNSFVKYEINIHFSLFFFTVYFTHFLHKRLEKTMLSSTSD